jgi:hypothetical protein
MLLLFPIKLVKLKIVAMKYVAAFRSFEVYVTLHGALKSGPCCISVARPS